MLTPAFNLMYTVPVVCARCFDDVTAFRAAAAYSGVAPALLVDDLHPSFASGS